MCSRTKPFRPSLLASQDVELRGWVNLAQDARNATDAEHELTLWQGLQLYPKACLWSMAVSLVIIMDGYDNALIGSLFAFPAFQKRFGFEVGNTGKYQLHASWQTALGLSGSLGSVIGIFINAVLTERFGHRKMVLGSLIILVGFIFILFFAKSVKVLLAGEILCGTIWGVFSTLAPAYASEVTPVVLRGYLETFVVLCWGTGLLISYGVLDSLNTHTGDWAWRIPFAIQWIWPVIIFPLILFAPESPWWLVRRGRLQDAEKSVKRLSSSKAADHAKLSVALMVETTNLERAVTEGASYIDCFRGSNLWRTEIGCISFLSQVLVGFAITTYASYFFEQAGLEPANAYKLTVGQGGLHFLCTLFSTLITTRHGRRPIMIWGYIVMSTSMYIIGFTALAHQRPAIGYAQSAMYLFWYCAYELTVGPAVYIIVGEISSTRLRSKSIALARNAYNICNIVSAVVAPYTLNPTEGNWKGKTAFLAAGLTTLVTIWAIFRLPESKGRTYQELDILFSKDLKAWQFKDASVDEDIPDDLVKQQ
ncbi:general substrate transporter [Xylogone sp. PMI_703]|nr:general substrate transporter [Xylogone sp. PMI_703]